MKDLHHGMGVTSALAIAAITTDTTTAGITIDTMGYEGLEFVLQSGTVTDGAYAVSIQEGDESDMSDAATVTAELILGDADFALADDDTAKRIGSAGKKRYQRLSITSTATSSGGTFGAVAILGNAHSAPVAD